MKKISNKGFTLIELLATILIIGLVLGITTYGIISSVNKSKDKGLALTESNIKKTAVLYSSEVDESKWQDITIPVVNPENTSLDKNILNKLIEEAKTYKFYCVTIQELINKGLLKNNDINDSSTFNLNTTIIVKKNKITLTVDKQYIIPTSVGLDDEAKINDDEAKINNALCTGTIIEEQPPTNPEITSTEPYTSIIEVFYNEAEYPEGSSSNVESHTCLLAKDKDQLFKNNSNVKKKNGENKKCTFKGLKDNTTYYLKVCMDSDITKEKNSYAACSDVRDVKTKEINQPTIKYNELKKITITYNNDNIYPENGIYMFNFSTNDTGIIGTSNVSVYECEALTDANEFSCEENPTTKIEKEKYYKLSSDKKEVAIEFQGTNTGSNKNKIQAITYDETKNNAKTEREFNLKETEMVTYTITFHKESAYKIGNSTNSTITKSCSAKKGESCQITTPSITRSGYTIIGWHSTKNSKDSEWNQNDTVYISNSGDYYPITKKTVTVTFNKNTAASIGSTKEQCTMYNSATSCNVKTPSITASSCNLVVGWSSNKDATSATSNIDNVNTNISVSANKTLYAITKATSRLSIPSSKKLIYNGQKQSISSYIRASIASSNYKTTGTLSATSVGKYKVSVTPNAGYCWTDDSSDEKTISWSIISFDVILKITGVPSTEFSQTYSVTNTTREVKRVACNNENCQDLGSNNCTSSSCKNKDGNEALAWSGKNPTISWSSNATNTSYTVEYNTNNTNDTKNKYNDFTSSWCSYDNVKLGNIEIGSDGYRVIKIVATNGSAEITLYTYLKLDYEPPEVTLPSGDNEYWGKSEWKIVTNDNGSGLDQSVNAFADPNYKNNCKAENFCGIINGGQSYYGAKTGEKITVCSSGYGCTASYRNLFFCVSDMIGNKKCAMKNKPKGTQTNYEYRVNGS